MPNGINVIIGYPTLAALDTIHEPASDHIIFKTAKVVVQTEPGYVFQERALFEIRGISCCAGAAFELNSYKDLRYTIKSWVAIETDTIARQVATALHPEIVFHDDVLTVTQEMVANWDPNLVTGGPPCQPWSRVKATRPKARNIPCALVFIR